jgi:hypothetical protein
MARIRRVLGLARVVIGLLISVVSLIKLILSLVGGATNYSVRCSGPTITIRTPEGFTSLRPLRAGPAGGGSGAF